MLVDEEQKAVMMEWEKPLMIAHAHAICSRGGDILNVGFGLGIIDEVGLSNQEHSYQETQPEIVKYLKSSFQRP